MYNEIKDLKWEKEACALETYEEKQHIMNKENKNVVHIINIE